LLAAINAFGRHHQAGDRRRPTSANACHSLAEPERGPAYGPSDVLTINSDVHALFGENPAHSSRHCVPFCGWRRWVTLQCSLARASNAGEALTVACLYPDNNRRILVVTARSEGRPLIERLPLGAAIFVT